MPKKSTAETESLWVPLFARQVCYCCGVGVADMESKDNCRLCFDVFCLNCFGTKMALPAHYGYTDPQPVCKTCALLLGSFPTFCSKIHNRQGGSLLPPRCAVMVLYCDIPSDQINQAGENESSSEGFFAGLLNKFRRKPDQQQQQAQLRQSMRVAADDRVAMRRSTVAGATPPAPRNDTCQSSYCRMPDNRTFGLRADDTMDVSMIGWRPLNPATAITIGSNIHICIKDVYRVSLLTSESDRSQPPPAARGGKAPPARAAPATSPTQPAEVGDGRIGIELRNGRACHLLVGSVTRDTDGPSPKGTDGASAGSDAEFTSDPITAQAFAAALGAIVKHARTHFAFSQASMALHVDMCPAPAQTRSAK